MPKSEPKAASKSGQKTEQKKEHKKERTKEQKKERHKSERRKEHKSEQKSEKKPEQNVEEKTEQKATQKKKTKKQRMDQVRMQELEEAFSIFDRDGDGSITKAELGEVLKGADVPFTPAQLDQFMEKLDKDGDGTVDYQEFCNLMREMVAKAVEMEMKIREAFGAIDVNGDGQISRSEIIKAMAIQGRELSAEEADEIIGTVDKDGNQTISYDEFVHMMYGLSLDE